MASSRMISISISLLAIFILASSAVASDVGRGPRLGGWQPIENANDPEIQELAKFALTEHNSKLRGGEPRLQLGRVLGGEKQVVAGMNYKLILAASSADGKNGKYEAVVWVKPWENFKKLTSFRSV